MRVGWSTLYGQQVGPDAPQTQPCTKGAASAVRRRGQPVLKRVLVGAGSGRRVGTGPSQPSTSSLGLEGGGVKMGFPWALQLETWWLVYARSRVT